MSKTDEFMRPKTTYSNTLKFTAYAWAKLLWMQDRGKTEVAGYGITATEDPLLITDFALVKQECTVVSFDFDEDGVADHTDKMLDAGLSPWAFSNILIHTHPGNCPNPSQTDENTFERVFTRPDWAIMLIVAEDGSIYCRLKLNVGPGSVQMLEVEVDYLHSFIGSDYEAWDAEYKTNVKVKELKYLIPAANTETNLLSVEHYDDLAGENWIGSKTEAGVEVDEFDSCHWDADGNVAYWNFDSDTWYWFEPLSGQWSIDVGEDGDVEEAVKIDVPVGSWVQNVVDWANKYANERQPAMRV